MNKKFVTSSQSKQQGVVLLEALIAVLIFSLGILGLVGLQANMLKNAGDSKFRSDASFVAQQRIGEMWADPANLANYVETNTDISNMLPNGKRTVTSIATNQYQVIVGWSSPGEAASVVAGPCQTMGVAHCFTTIATIAGG
jgi:type IV pilus assembly protein PilV